MKKATSQAKLSLTAIHKCLPTTYSTPERWILLSGTQLSAASKTKFADYYSSAFKNDLTLDWNL